MISNKALKMNSQYHGLSEWIVTESKTYPGKKYYFNIKSKVTTWKCPRELQAANIKNVTNQQRKVLKAVRPSSKISCLAKTNTIQARINKDVKIATPAEDKTKPTEKRNVKGTFPNKKNEACPSKQGKVAKSNCKTIKRTNSRQCNVNEKQEVLKINVKERKSIKEIINTKPSSKSSVVKQIRTSTAKDRLLSLRKSLTEEAEKQLAKENAGEYIPRDINVEEPMEIDEIVDEIKQVRYDALSLSSNLSGNNLPLIGHKENISNGSIVIVADTNVFIGNFDVIEMIIISQIKGNGFMPMLVVPWRVINELDFLKDPKDKQQHSLMFRAKRALNFLYKMLPTHPRIKGQTLKDANNHIFPSEVPDDDILNCCFQIVNDSHTVILLSCDKNLCNKAVINGIKAVNAKEMESMLVSAPDPNAHDVSKCNVSLNPNELQLFQDAILKLLSRVLEGEMKRKFDNMWEMIVLKRPPWSLSDVLACLVKHWMAVISELFPRMQDVVKELSQMVNRKSKNLWLNQDIIKFKDLSLKLAEKCILLPEYSDLARECIQILKKEEVTPSDCNLNVQSKVISALENIWSFFSSFSAVLATNTNIPHILDVTYKFDENMNIQDSLHTVLRQLTLLITNVERVLSQCGNTLDQFTEIQSLCSVINDTLKGIGAGSTKIETDELSSFCLSNRGLLEAVPAKFIQLNDLLSECDAQLKTVC